MQHQVAHEVLGETPRVTLPQRLHRRRLHRTAQRVGQVLHELRHPLVLAHRRARRPRLGVQLRPELRVFLEHRPELLTQRLQDRQAPAPLLADPQLPGRLVRRDLVLARRAHRHARETQQLRRHVPAHRRPLLVQLPRVILSPHRRELVRQKRRVPADPPLTRVPRHRPPEKLVRVQDLPGTITRPGQFRPRPTDVQQPVIVAPARPALDPRLGPHRLQAVLGRKTGRVLGRQPVQVPHDRVRHLGRVRAVHALERLEQQHRALDVPPPQPAVLDVQRVRHRVRHPALTQPRRERVHVIAKPLPRQLFVQLGRQPPDQHVQHAPVLREPDRHLLAHDESLEPTLRQRLSPADRVVIGDRHEVHAPRHRLVVHRLRLRVALRAVDQPQRRHRRAVGRARMAVRIDPGPHDLVRLRRQTRPRRDVARHPVPPACPHAHGDAPLAPAKHSGRGGAPVDSILTTRPRPRGDDGPRGRRRGPGTAAPTARATSQNAYHSPARRTGHEVPRPDVPGPGRA